MYVPGVAPYPWIRQCNERQKLAYDEILEEVSFFALKCEKASCPVRFKFIDIERDRSYIVNIVIFFFLFHMLSHNSS